ncbi:MAG: DNA-binding protein [Candidatus Kryptoniota bacterium]
MKAIDKTAMFVLLITFSLSYAQGMRGGWNQGQGPRFYDKSTVTTISGKVTSVNTLQPRRQGMSGLISVDLKTPSGTFVVHLGPAWYFDDHNFKVARGSMLTVTGSRVMLNGQNVVIAAEVRNEKTSLRLRNDDGFPVWSRRGQ